MQFDGSTSQTPATAISEHPGTWKTTPPIRQEDRGAAPTRRSRQPSSPALPRSSRQRGREQPTKVAANDLIEAEVAARAPRLLASVHGRQHDTRLYGGRQDSRCHQTRSRTRDGRRSRISPRARPAAPSSDSRRERSVRRPCFLANAGMRNPSPGDPSGVLHFSDAGLLWFWGRALRGNRDSRGRSHSPSRPHAADERFGDQALARIGPNPRCG